MKKLWSVACLAMLLAAGVPSPSTAQLTDIAKQTGKATKGAVEKVGTAGKKVGDETKQVVTGRPKDATGLCRDRTYTTAKTKAHSCDGHGGVEKWY